MSWTRKLTPPIELKDDRRLETLADVMLGLPERNLQNGHWVCAGELLMEAPALAFDPSRIDAN
jgi:hypothetical protein